MGQVLINPNSTRVTYAAVFIPFDGGEPEFVLPADMKVIPFGFFRYDYEKHHRSKGLGKLCCGNCYSEGREIEISHRSGTARRIAGGKFEGYHATFTALSNKIGEHTEFCQNRRQYLEQNRLSGAAVLNINIPETYSKNYAPLPANENHHYDHGDPRLDGTQPIAINESLSEISRKVTRFSRDQIQTGFLTIDGYTRTFRQGYVDGDGWWDLVREQTILGNCRRSGGAYQPHKIFAVTNPASKCLRAFSFASDGKKEVKISCRQLEYTDEDNGDVHVIQPSIFTSSEEVKALFEIRGDYQIAGKFRIVSNESKKGSGVFIHQVQILAESANLGHRLYSGGPKERLRDLEAIELLQRAFEEVSIIDRKNQARARPANDGNKPLSQPDLFSGFTP